MRTKGRINRLTGLFAAIYMVSYMTRINFGAVLSEIETSTGWPRTLLSGVVTGSFITYGAGQLVSGYIADCYSPKRLLFGGLVLTSLMNLMMAFCPSPRLMLVIWCVNGFAQAFMWPPLARLMVATFHGDIYKKASVRITFGSAIGTILIYFVAPLLFTWFNWRAVFCFSALCGVTMALFWQKFCIDINQMERPKTQPRQLPTKRKFGIFLRPPVLAVMLAIVLQGMLRDGVTTWMPTYIADTYHLGTLVSIMTGTVMPLFTILYTELASLLYRKKLKNPVTCAAALFAMGVVAALSLAIITGKSAALSVASSALLTGSMQGVCTLLTAMTLPAFETSGNVSTVSGVFNACTYIGSSISTYGIALVSECSGWSFTILVWLGIAALGASVCLLAAHAWKYNFMTVND